MRALGRNLTPAERDDIRLAAERVERWWDPGDPEDVAELVEALEDADYAYARDDGRYIAAAHAREAVAVADNERRSFSRRHSETRGWFSR